MAVRNLVALMCCALGWAAVSVRAAEVGPGEDIRTAIGGLQPGDELVLRGGTYAFDSAFRISVSGTEANPIVIRAKTGEIPVIHQTNSGQNVVEVRGSHLVLRGIEFTGGSHGIRLMDADFVTIERCHIHDTGDVAISANSGGTYTGLRILRNHIHDTNGTGEGMYLGCNNDACRVADSLIEGNYVHHTNGPNVVQGDGIELKEGSYGNVIRHNVIHDTNYPNILTYSTVGNGPPNVIEGNVMWASGDNALQVAADAVIRNNIILGAPVAFQPHQAGVPSNIEFVHNTVVTTGTAVYVRSVSGPVTLANNAIYAQGGAAINVIGGDTSQVTLAGNVGDGGVAGASGGFADGGSVFLDFVNGHFAGSPPVDLYPSADSRLIGAGDEAFMTTHDFNGGNRELPPDAGAYAFSSEGNPGWAISEQFKPLSGDVPKPPELRND